MMYDPLLAEKITAIENSVRRDLNNPLFSESDRLEIAIGAVIFREKLIYNLRKQIKNLQQLLLQSGVDGIIIEQHQYKHLQESNDD